MTLTKNVCKLDHPWPEDFMARITGNDEWVMLTIGPKFGDIEAPTASEACAAAADKAVELGIITFEQENAARDELRKFFAPERLVLPGADPLEVDTVNEAAARSAADLEEDNRLYTTEPLGVEKVFQDLWERLAVTRIDGRKLNVRLDAKTSRADMSREMLVRVTAESGGLLNDELQIVLDTIDDMDAGLLAEIQNNGLEITMM